MISSPAGEGAGMVENTEELVLIVEWRNVSHPKKSDEGNRTSTRYPTAYLIVTVSFFHCQGIEAQRGKMTRPRLHSR